jgi:hypothetical protein
MKNSMKLVLVLGSAALLVSFQNCGKSMSFTGDDMLTAQKTDVSIRSVDDQQLPGTPGNLDSGTVDPSSSPLPMASPTPPILASPTPTSSPAYGMDCEGGKLDDVDKINMSLGSLDDLILHQFHVNPHEEHVVLQARNIILNQYFENLQVDSSMTFNANMIRGASFAKVSVNSNSVSAISDVITGSLKVRSATMDSIQSIKSDSLSLSAHAIKSVSAVAAKDSVCVAAEKLGSISDIKGNSIRIIGTGSSPALVDAIHQLNWHPGKGDTLIANTNVTSIHEVDGQLVIRDSVIDSLYNVSADIVLINSKVKEMHNISGATVTLQNSTVDQMSNVSAQVITIP